MVASSLVGHEVESRRRLTRTAAVAVRSPAAAPPVADGAAAPPAVALAAPPADAPAAPEPAPAAAERTEKGTLYERLDRFFSRVSMKSPVWQRLCSWVWLPYAFHSGIRMKRVAGDTFMAVLPFRRFNRNWYNAMAGAALLGNTEIAAGFYIFGVCGSEYTVVCKNLNYRFLRPCMGPALYRMTPKQEIKPLLESKQEFNLTLDVDILEQSLKKSKKDRRVGRCEVTFHVTPKAHHKRKAGRKKLAAAAGE